MTDWAALLRRAVLRMGLAPDAVWRLSLVEWRALTAAEPDPFLNRAELDALARAWPD